MYLQVSWIVYKVSSTDCKDSYNHTVSKSTVWTNKYILCIRSSKADSQRIIKYVDRKLINLTMIMELDWLKWRNRYGGSGQGIKNFKVKIKYTWLKLANGNNMSIKLKIILKLFWHRFRHFKIVKLTKCSLPNFKKKFCIWKPKSPDWLIKSMFWKDKTGLWVLNIEALCW